MRGSLDRSAGSAWCFAKGLINTTTKKEKKKLVANKYVKRPRLSKAQNLRYFQRDLRD